jgi:hypothetical protein
VRRPRVEAWLPVIHARDLGKIMAGDTGTIVWRDGDATPIAWVNYHVMPHGVEYCRAGHISWSVRAMEGLRGSRRATVLLVPGHVRFGTRWWLSCPACATRRAHLYLIGAVDWRCRSCAGLAYRSQQLAEYDRIAYRAGKIANDRLGVSWTPQTPIRFKPARMHSRTFERHRATLDALEQRREWLDRVIGTRLLGWIDADAARHLRQIRGPTREMARRIYLNSNSRRVK